MSESRAPADSKEETPATDGRIIAPWTPEQVRALNEYQRGPLHPFTCGAAVEHRRGPDETWESYEERRTLIATQAGWICPTCDYTQDWAHDFMAMSSSIPSSIPGVSPDVKKMLDELEDSTAFWYIKAAPEHGLDDPEVAKRRRAKLAARSSLESAFVALEKERDEARNILLGAVDRDINVKDTLRTLATVASNGIFWRDKEIASLRVALDKAEARLSAFKDQAEGLRNQLAGEREDYEYRLSALKEDALTQNEASQAWNAVMSYAPATDGYLGTHYTSLIEKLDRLRRLSSTGSPE